MRARARCRHALHQITCGHELDLVFETEGVHTISDDVQLRGFAGVDRPSACRSFVQYSPELQTLRWSWRDYIHLDQIVEIQLKARLGGGGAGGGGGGGGGAAAAAAPADASTTAVSGGGAGGAGGAFESSGGGAHGTLKRQKTQVVLRTAESLVPIGAAATGGEAGGTASRWLQLKQIAISGRLFERGGGDGAEEVRCHREGLPILPCPLPPSLGLTLPIIPCRCDTTARARWRRI